MPVRKQLVPVQFGGGINTKVDSKQLQAGQLLTLQNAQFTKTNQLNKRPGYTILNNNIEGGGTITTGVELAAYQDELILFDGNNLYSYLTATGNWSNRGTAISVTSQDKNIIRTSGAQQLNPDMAMLNNVEVYAWEDSRGGVRYCTQDTTTQAFGVSDTLLFSSGQQPKCVAFSSYLMVFYSDGANTLYYQLINPLNPTVVQARVAVAVDGYAGTNGFPYDVSVIGNKLFVAYLSDSTASGAIQAFSLDASFVKSTVTIVENTSGHAITTGYHGAITVAGDSGNNVWISWATGATVRIACYSYTFVSILASTLVDSVDARVLTATASTASNTILLFYEVHAANAYNELTHYRTIDQSGALGTLYTIRSVGVGTKAFSYGGNIYFTGAYESTLQATDFLFLIAQQGTILSKAVIIARFTPLVAGGLQTNGMAPNIVAISTGVFEFANTQAGKIISEANTVFSLYGVNSSQMIFIPSDNFVNTVQANTLLIVGGILQGYDGVSTTELGFLLYPENISLSTSTGGSLSTGTYQYVVCYEWTDNNGQVYRSTPSVAASIDVTSGQSVIVTGPTLRLTAKQTPINIVIYRTEANDTLFRRVTSSLSPLQNDTTVDTFTFTDTLSDASSAANELLYTTGNILPNAPPPANSIISTFGDRVFLAGLSDKLTMWYSQTVVDNSANNSIPPQFAEALTLSVDPRGGNITALGILNQVLIIFKESSIFALQGNGPDATGNNNDYGEATMITSDVGCINDVSVVIVPQGLMFQSAKGIYLLDQSFNLSYIGAPVESYNSLTITSATLNATANQVIFTTSSGTALVYDYYMQQWATWTNHYVADSLIYNNIFTFLTPQGSVWQQNTASFTDGSSPIYMSFTLPNLAFAGLQGYARVFRAYILGTYKGTHTLNVSVAYDYNDNYTQFATITPTAPTNTWGSDAFWGSSPTWGGETNSLYEFRIDFNIQKCTAIRLYVSDNQVSSYNEGYAISSIVFEVGVLPGGNRLPASNTFGAQ